MDRDDVVAAVFAAELNQGLKEVDDKTTNRPNMTPPAARLDPRSLLRRGAPNPQGVFNTEDVGPSFAPVPLKDLLIPMPGGPAVVDPNAKMVSPPPLPSQANPLQLELGLPSTDAKRPGSAPAWFEHLDKRLNGLESDIRILTNRVIELKNIVLAKRTKKSTIPENTRP